MGYKGKGLGALFVLGTIIGAITTLLFATDEKGNTKKGVKDRVSKAKGRLNEIEEVRRVQEVFGEKTQEAQQVYLQAKDEVASRVQSLRNGMDSINKAKYRLVVDEVMSELKEAGSITGSQLKKLKNFLVEDYEKLREDVVEENTKGKTA
jgi:gas vesicle protein